MNSPSHEKISSLAYEIWQQRGCPNGQDTEIWFEAEKRLTKSGTRDSAGHDGARTEPPAEIPAPSEPLHAIGPSPEEQKRITAEVEKIVARAPQVPHHTAPKPKPAETGKPVWGQKR